MKDDTALLREFIGGSEPAFAELVERRIGLVYGVACRQLPGREHLAEDVAQEVFVRLARQAVNLSSHPALAAWLHRTAQFVAIDLLRKEQRRQVRETETAAMNDAHTAAPAPAHEMERALDPLLAQLREIDRNVLVLRFLHDLPFREVGVRLQLSEDGARMRAQRALERLREGLNRRGIASTAAALTASLSAQATTIVPAGLAAQVTAAALATPMAAGVFAAGGIAFMNTTKTVVVGAGLLALAAVGFGIAQQRRAVAAEQLVASLRQERAALVAQMAAARSQEQQSAMIPSPTPALAGNATTAGVRVEGAVTLVGPTLDETKAVLARIVSSVGDVELAPEHRANIRAWATRDDVGLIQWINTLPSTKQREHTLEAVIAVETEANPEFAYLITSGIERDVPRFNRRFEVIRDWARRDQAAARQAVNETRDISDVERRRLMAFVEAAPLMRERKR